MHAEILGQSAASAEPREGPFDHARHGIRPSLLRFISVKVSALWNDANVPWMSTLVHNLWLWKFRHIGCLRLYKTDCFGASFVAF